MLWSTDSSASDRQSPWRLLDWQTVGVLASAICLLLLSIPGVRVVQAADEVATAGEMCEATSADSNAAVEGNVAAALERLHQAKKAGNGVSAANIVVLNTSGYNYRPAPIPPRIPAGPTAR